MKGIEIGYRAAVKKLSGEDWKEDGKDFQQLWDWSLKILKALAELVRLKQLKEDSKLGRPASSEALLEHENKKEAAWTEARKIISDFSKAHKQLMEVIKS